MMITILFYLSMLLIAGLTLYRLKKEECQNNHYLMEMVDLQNKLENACRREARAYEKYQLAIEQVAHKATYQKDLGLVVIHRAKRHNKQDTRRQQRNKATTLSSKQFTPLTEDKIA